MMNGVLWIVEESNGNWLMGECTEREWIYKMSCMFGHDYLNANVALL